MTDQDLTELKGLMEKAKADDGKPYGVGLASHPKDGVPYEEEWWPSSKSDAAYALLRHAPALIRAKEREKKMQDVVDAAMKLRTPCDGYDMRGEADEILDALDALSAFDAQSETR